MMLLGLGCVVYWMWLDAGMDYFLRFGSVEMCRDYFKMVFCYMLVCILLYLHKIRRLLDSKGATNGGLQDFSEVRIVRGVFHFGQNRVGVVDCEGR